MSTSANDLISTHFNVSLNLITWIFRILFFVLPVATFMITRRICFGLQRKDRELALHGHETGRVVRFASGEFIEVHKPLDEYERWVLVSQHSPAPLEIEPAEDANGVARPGYQQDKRRQRLSRFFYEDRIEPVTPSELAAAQSHGEHDELEGSETEQLEARTH